MRFIKHCLLCEPGDNEQAEVAVAYDSDNVDEVGKDSDKMTKSGRSQRRRGSRVNTAASYHSIDSRSRQADPSLRGLSVSSVTQRFIDVVL